MQPHSPPDRALLIPVGVILLSSIGICWVLLASGLGARVRPPTATPSSLIPLEAAKRSPSPSRTSTPEEIPPTATKTRPKPSPSPSPTASMTEALPTPSATFTPVYIQSLQGGKFDDVDANIAYDPYWTALKNPSTRQSYLGTIHASNSVGNEASFRFSGKRFSLGYQRGKSFGTVTVLVDDQTFSFSEQDFALVWHSPQLTPGDHLVRILHESGESVNLDYIEIVK